MSFFQSHLAKKAWTLDPVTENHNETRITGSDINNGGIKEEKDFENHINLTINDPNQTSHSKAVDDVERNDISIFKRTDEVLRTSNSPSHINSGYSVETQVEIHKSYAVTEHQQVTGYLQSKKLKVKHVNSSTKVTKL